MVQYMKYFISSSRFFNTSHTPMNWSVALPLGKLNVSLLTLYQSSLPPSRYLSFVKPLNHALRLDELRFWCSGINLSNTSIRMSPTVSSTASNLIMPNARIATMPWLPQHSFFSCTWPISLKNTTDKKMAIFVLQCGWHKLLNGLISAINQVCRCIYSLKSRTI